MAAAPRRSQYHWFYEAMKRGEFMLAVTTEILQEYEEKLAEYYSSIFADNVLKTILNLPHLEQVVVYFKWNLIVYDYDDNKFVDAAIACNTDYIVTHDKHFNVLKNVPFPKVKHVSLQEFHVLFYGKPMPLPV